MSFSSSLRHKVSIQSPGEPSSDSEGNVVKSWVTICQPYADIRHSSGLESVRSDSVTSTVKASIRIRYRDGITAGMRVVHGTLVYNINAVLPDLQQRLYVDLVCEVIQ